VDGQLKSVVVTSPGQAEGKTTTCANIAVCMAQAGRKVLLLECDLRKPKIHKYFGLHNDKGLTDIIVNNVESESVIKQVDEIENLYIISCGLLPPNPTEILESTKMINLTNKLKENYDLVIMDSPPVGELTDAAIISKMSDGVILVLASGEVNIEVARHAKIALENVNAKILGVVLTKLGRHSGSSYYYKYRYYYYE
jgi:capsular exopolysaccharide synthesis family protein